MRIAFGKFFEFLSLQSVVGFAMGFGWAGLAGLRGALWPWWGAVLAGVVLSWIGYGGLALLVGIAVVATVALASFGRAPQPVADASGG